MPALGRPFTLGALYDCQTDSIVSGFSLWELDKLNANTVSTATPKTFSKVLKQDDVTHRANALSMKVSHRVDYLAGKCGQISGAATFLDHHPASITSNRVILHHSCTTETRALLVSNLSGSGMHSSDRVDSSRATHVVTSITYGAEAFFVFENKLGNAVFPDTKTPESMALQDAVNRLGVVKRQAAESHSAYDLPKLPQGSDIACHYFGDFKVGNTPRTYGDSARMIAEIPELLADKDNIVPKVVYLQPLSAFYSSASRQLFLEIDSVLMGQASTVLEYLNFVQHRSHDISENKVTAIFPEIRKIVDKFQDIVKQYHVSFTEKLIQHIQSIRFGASDPEPLKILLREHDASRFSKGVLGKWMEKRTLEVRWLMSLLDRLITQSETSAGAVKIVTSSAEFQMLLLNSKVKNYIYFQFQIMSKKDRFVRDLKLELGRILNCGNNDDSADPFMELPEYWFDNLSNVSFLTSRLNDFLDLAFANSGSTEFGFALCGTSTGDEFAPNATCKTLLYRTETNLFEAEEVALPLPPTISSVQKIDSFGNGPNGNRCSILVSCLGNVQRCPKTFNDAMKFMMYYRKYPVDQMDTAWSIANVEVTGPLLNLRATVNNLVPDQKYEFKVRSEGKLRTSFSKVHVIESLKNDSGILDKLGWKTVNVVRRKWKTYARLARDKKDFLNGIPMVTPQKAKRPAGVSNDRTQTKQVTGGQRSKKTPTQGNTTQERRQPTKNHEEPHGDWENVESSEDDEEDENDGRPDSGYAGNSASDYTYGTQYQSPQFYGDEDDDDDDDSDEDEDSDEDDDDERIAYMMAQMGQQHGGPNGFSAQNSRQVQRQMMAQQAYQAQQYGAISGNQQHYGGQFPDFGGRGRQTQYHGGQPRPRGHGSPGQQASYGGQYLPPGYPGSHY